MEVDIDPDAIYRIREGCHDFLNDVIGPLITLDAKRYAPKRTSAMADAIYYEVEGLTLNVISPVYYSIWVELGHNIFHPSTGMDGPGEVPQEPFLRPALYKYRTPAAPDPVPLFPVAVPHPGGPTYPNLRLYYEHDLGWTWNRSSEGKGS